MTDRVEWKAVRETIDLAAVATALLGSPPGRRGARSGRFWWRCPLGTHEDKNPSFCVAPGKGWRCFGCGEHGDAASLVMRVRGVDFPEAVRYLTGDVWTPPNGQPPSVSRKAPSKPLVQSSG